jgi:potassium-dependent mechanosensitive channel
MAQLLSRPARYLAAALAAFLFYVYGQAQAQLPLLPSTRSTGNAAPVAPPPAVDEDRLAAELRVKLAAERQQLEVLDSPGGLPAGAPLGTDEQSLRLRHFRVALLVRNLEQQLADLARLAADRARRGALQQEMQTWTGFSGQPPYSILLADSLRAEHQAAQTSLEGLKSRAELLRQTTERARERIKEAELQLRRVSEQGERASGEVEAARLAWEREQAQLFLRTAQSSAAATDTARQVLDEEEAIAKMEVEFARRKLAAVSDETRFAAADLEQVRAAQSAEADKLGREIDRLTREQARRQAAADAARQALDAARAARPVDADAQAAAHLRPLERDYELQRARLEAVAAVLESLRQASEFNRARVALWEGRYAAHQDQSAARRLALREATDKLLSYLNLQKKLLDQESQRAEAAVLELEGRQERSQDAAELGFLDGLKTTYAERAAGTRRALAGLAANVVLAQQIQAEFGGGGAQRSFAERREDWLASSARSLAAAWNFELLAVEDSIEVAGKVIAGTRSITVGKIATALVMLVAGYALAVLLARLGEKLLIRRFAWQPGHAGVVSRWLLAVEFVLLLVIVLAWVKIPITVFAFLGGAVAIGLGFGMQTLLKNLMSGLMILGEQPFRLGDMVEIGGIRGTVTNIGLRASTINDANGIDTIIPNSSFIEQNLTNWTLTTGRVRFNIRVGVAYGSPVRTVTHVVTEVAARHGQVLKDPPPEVLFEDFGADALVFALHYWLDIRTSVVPRQVASDLRSMIDASFADHGLVIAFPQRDVHLDAARPLAVRIVREEAAPAPADRQA